MAKLIQKYVSHKYGDAKKLKAIRTYLQTGNLAETHRRLRIPYETLIEWKKSSWWEAETQRLREELDTKLASKIDEVVENAVDQIKERVETGEKILDSKSGRVINVPVKTRDLTQAVKTLSDRQDVLIGRQKREAISNVTLNEKLNMLAKQFEKFAGKQKKPEIVEAIFEEVQDALHEERQA